jgi:cell division protein FtsQ
MSVGARRLAYVAVALAAGWLALLSPVFALDAEKVEIIGAGAIVDPALVAATVAPYEGRSLASLNTGHIAHQIQDLPGVREAVVDRVWPAGLRVTITTRVPVAAIARPEGGYVLLDDQAIQVAVIDAVPADIPVVAIPLEAGNERILDTVITVINELPANVRARVGIVSAATEDSVQFELRDGPRVEWGSAEQSALKASVLATILGSAQAQSAAVIDVSAPTLPITRAS